MTEFLMLRFDAPLMSFGAPIVDKYGRIQPYPALSMITGLLGNALGYLHGDAEALRDLQERIRYASRADRPGEMLHEFQTVALGQEHLLDTRAWTTRGTLDQRAGASSKDTHIRYRDYWADAIHTAVLTLEEPSASPDLDALEEALRSPARPLFIGRKACLPASPILLGRIQADGLVQALERAPLPERLRQSTPRVVDAWWPLGATSPQGSDLRVLPVTDRRDWRNQLHVSERHIVHGKLHIGDAAEESSHDS